MLLGTKSFLKLIGLAFFCSGMLFCGGDEAEVKALHSRSLSDGPLVASGRVEPVFKDSATFIVAPHSPAQVSSRRDSFGGESAEDGCCSDSICGFYAAFAAALGGLAWLKNIFAPSF